MLTTRPPAGVDHVRDYRARAVEGALEMHRDHFVPLILGHLRERRDVPVACVVDQDPDLAELAPNAVRGRLDVPEARHVHLDGEHAAPEPEPGDLGHDSSRPGNVAVPYRHVAAFAREAKADRAADPRRPAGHDRDSVFQGHKSSFRLRRALP
jgi:hypothetical protein